MSRASKRVMLVRRTMAYARMAVRLEGAVTNVTLLATSRVTCAKGLLKQCHIAHWKRFSTTDPGEGENSSESCDGG